VEINLDSLDGYISIDVRDNGKGFTPDEVNPGSHGLTGMRHRVEAAGGRLSVVSAHGAGTKISAVLPKPR
jgi:signal transduction histidine kinase